MRKRDYKRKKTTFHKKNIKKFCWSEKSSSLCTRKRKFCSMAGPFVSRLGREIFILQRAVRLCYGLLNLKGCDARQRSNPFIHGDGCEVYQRHTTSDSSFFIHYSLKTKRNGTPQVMFEAPSSEREAQTSQPLLRKDYAQLPPRHPRHQGEGNCAGNVP